MSEHLTPESCCGTVVLSACLEDIFLFPRPGTRCLFSARAVCAPALRLQTAQGTVLRGESSVPTGGSRS